MVLLAALLTPVQRCTTTSVFATPLERPNTWRVLALIWFVAMAATGCAGLGDGAKPLTPAQEQQLTRAEELLEKSALHHDLRETNQGYAASLQALELASQVLPRNDMTMARFYLKHASSAMFAFLSEDTPSAERKYRADESKRLFLRVYHMRREQLGPDHPETLELGATILEMFGTDAFR